MCLRPGLAPLTLTGDGIGKGTTHPSDTGEVTFGGGALGVGGGAFGSDAPHGVADDGEEGFVQSEAAFCVLRVFDLCQGEGEGVGVAGGCV